MELDRPSETKQETESGQQIGVHCSSARISKKKGNICVVQFVAGGGINKIFTNFNQVVKCLSPLTNCLCVRTRCYFTLNCEAETVRICAVN